MKSEMTDLIKRLLSWSGTPFDDDAHQAADRIEELVKERDELGRKLNTARYGQPDFAWSIHEEAMADLRAKLATCEKYSDAYAECDRIGTQAARDLEAKLAKAVEDAEKWRYAFAAQSRKLQAVLYIEGVKAVLAELEGK